MKSNTTESLLLAARKQQYSKPKAAFALAEKAAMQARKEKNLFQLAQAEEIKAYLARILGDLVTARASAQSALLYYRAKKMQDREANCLLAIGRITFAEGNIEKAYRSFQEAERVADREAEDAGLRATAIALQGNALLAIGQPAKALRNLLRGLAICQKYDLVHEKGMLFQWISTFYFLEADYDKSLSYASDALALLIRSNDRHNECFVLNSIGIAYGMKRDQANSYRYFAKAVQLANELGIAYMMVWSLSNLITWQINNKKRKEADASVKKLLSLAAKTTDIVSRATIMSSAASYYMTLNKPELAIKNLRNALKSFSSFQIGQLQVLEKLLEIYIQIDDTDNALHTLQEYLALKDQFFSATNQQEIASLEQKFERKKRSAGDEKLEKYSQHRMEKKEFIQSVKKKIAGSKGLEASFIRNLEQKVSPETDLFDHELYIATTYNDFIMRLSKRFPVLSSTELKIATLLRLNMPSKKIASLFSISVRTIEFHRANIRKKMKLKTSDNLSLALMKI